MKKLITECPGTLSAKLSSLTATLVNNSKTLERFHRRIKARDIKDGTVLAECIAAMENVLGDYYSIFIKFIDTDDKKAVAYINDKFHRVVNKYIVPEVMPGYRAIFNLHYDTIRSMDGSLISEQLADFSFTVVTLAEYNKYNKLEGSASTRKKCKSPSKHGDKVKLTSASDDNKICAAATKKKSSCKRR